MCDWEFFHIDKLFRVTQNYKMNWFTVSHQVTLICLLANCSPSVVSGSHQSGDVNSVSTVSAPCWRLGSGWQVVRILLSPMFHTHTDTDWQGFSSNIRLNSRHAFLGRYKQTFQYRNTQQVARLVTLVIRLFFVHTVQKFVVGKCKKIYCCPSWLMSTFLNNKNNLVTNNDVFYFIYITL